MTKVLLTAFEPFDGWQENSSWLALLEFTRELPQEPRITTRKYPVDFDATYAALSKDLEQEYDVVLHLGQATGQVRLHLEALAVNVRGPRDALPDAYGLLVPDGPEAFRSQLPLAQWAGLLREAGIPAQVSYHAGTFLCNAVLYWTHLLISERGYGTRATFLHLPLECRQVLESKKDWATMPAGMMARALRIISGELVK